jgi:hypothetical protein
MSRSEINSSSKKASITFKMLAADQDYSNILLDLSPVGISAADYHGYNIIVTSEETLEEGQFYLSYGADHYNCHENQSCIVEGQSTIIIIC